MTIPIKADSDILYAAEWNAVAADTNLSLKSNASVDSLVRQKFLGGISTETILNVGLLTLPTTADTLIGRATADTITGAKTFTTDTLIAPNIGPNSTQRHAIPAVASDTIGLLAASQAFLNKTMGSTNNVTAKHLFTNTVVVDLDTSGSVPAANQVLTMVSPTQAKFLDPVVIQVQQDGVPKGTFSTINFLLANAGNATNITTIGAAASVPVGTMGIFNGANFVGTAASLQFTGGLIASVGGGVATISNSGGGGGGSSGLTIKDASDTTVGPAAGVNLIKFTGAGLTGITTNGVSGVTVTLAGGGGGGGNFSTPSNQNLDMGGSGMGHNISNVTSLVMFGLAGSSATKLSALTTNGNLIATVPSIASDGADGFFQVFQGGTKLLEVGQNTGNTLGLTAIGIDAYIKPFPFNNVGTQPTPSGNGGALYIGYHLNFVGFTSPSDVGSGTGKMYRRADGHIYYDNGVSGQTNPVVLDTVLAGSTSVTITPGTGDNSNVLTFTATGGGGGSSGFPSPVTTDLDMNSHQIKNVSTFEGTQHTFQTGGLQRMTISSTGVGLSSTLNAGNNIITGLPTPVNASDAATKTYVDNHVGPTGPTGPQGPAGTNGTNGTGNVTNTSGAKSMGTGGVGASLSTTVGARTSFSMNHDLGSSPNKVILTVRSGSTLAGFAVEYTAVTSSSIDVTATCISSSGGVSNPLSCGVDAVVFT